MKNTYGLLLAIGLGVAGAMLNWAYLHRRSREIESLSFIGIAHDRNVRAGDTFRREDLVEVKIPRDRAGTLGKVAEPWLSVDTVVGTNAVRDFQEDELVLHHDLRTAPPEPRALLEDEREIGI